MFLLPYHVTFIIIYVITAFYHYRLQEKAIKKVLKNLLSVPGNQV